MIRYTSKPGRLLVQYFIALRGLFSTTHTFYCSKEKTFSEGLSTFAAKQIQAG